MSNNRLMNSLRENPSLFLTLASTLVAVSRYMVVFAFTERFHISGEVWNWFNACSGIGMALLEGFAVWFCWNSWSRARPSGERNILLVLILAMFLSLTGAVAPAMQATTKGVGIDEVMPGDFLWLWTIAVTTAPFLVMAASGMADKLRKEALLPESEPAREEYAVMKPKVEGIPPLTLEDARQLNPNASQAELGRMLWISPQAVSQQLARKKRMAEKERALIGDKS